MEEKRGKEKGKSSFKGWYIPDPYIFHLDSPTSSTTSHFLMSLACLKVTCFQIIQTSYRQPSIPFVLTLLAYPIHQMDFSPKKYSRFSQIYTWKFLGITNKDMINWEVPERALLIHKSLASYLPFDKYCFFHTLNLFVHLSSTESQTTEKLWSAPEDKPKVSER